MNKRERRGRRWAQRIGVLMGVLLLCLTGVESNAETADRPPNFVIILADDLGYGDLGCYGSEMISTPHLDRMAREGMRFTDFHSNGAVCSPTRAALVTGRYQQRCGVEGVVTAKNHREAGLPLGEITFAEILGRAGYVTALFGKWHLGYPARFNPVHQGFDRFEGFVSGNIDYHAHVDQEMYADWWKQDTLEPRSGYLTDLVTKDGLTFIRKHRGGPFCLFLAHGAPHYPYQGRKDPAFRVAGEERTREAVDDVERRYIEMIGVMDEGIGRILDLLAELQLEEHTLVLFASDNGPASGIAKRMGSAGPLRGRKGTLWEGGHRVPAIAWWPGTVPPGVTTGETAMGMDVAVTMVALAGGEQTRDHSFDGIDLSPVLKDLGGLPERTLFWRHHGDRAVRKGSWKLVVNSSGNHLFNLASDPGERRDLASEHPGRAASLAKELSDWERDVSEGVTRISG